MTIEAQGSAIYVRCGSGDGDVIEFDRAPEDDMVSVSLWFDVTSPIVRFVDEKYGEETGGIPFISLHHREALALGHMLIAMASRQLEGPPVAHVDEGLQRRMSKKFDYPEISLRSYNALRGSGLFYLGDVAALSESDLRRIPSIGSKSIKEIKDILAEHGMSFGSDVSGWKRPTP